MFFKKEQMHIQRSGDIKKRFPLINGCILTAAIYRENGDNQKLLVAGANGPATSPILYMDLVTEEIHCTYQGHDETISDLLFLDDKKFVSACRGGVIKIWDIVTEDSLQIQAHDQGITCLLKMENTFLTASSDSTIKEWNFEGELIHCYTGHSDTVFSLDRINMFQFASLSANNDHRILIWDIDSKEMISEIDIAEAKGSYKLIALSDTHLVTAGAQVSLWEISTGEQQAAITEEFYYHGISSMCKITNDLLAIGADSLIFLITLSDFTISTKLSVHQSGQIYKILSLNDSFLSFGEEGCASLHNSYAIYLEQPETKQATM